MNKTPYPIWEKTTIAEAEEMHMIKDERLGKEAVAFGFINHMWIDMLNKMQENDELYNFCSNDVSWANLAGRKGIALVRDGKIVSELFTRIN